MCSQGQKDSRGNKLKPIEYEAHFPMNNVGYISSLG